MRSKIYKAMTILICIVSFIDWPVSSNAQRGKVISRAVEDIAKSAEKEGGLFKCCSNATQGAEEGVNKATQRAGEFDLPRPAAGAGAVNAVRRANANQTSNYNTSNEVEYVEARCPFCEGSGVMYDSEGYEYECGTCHGAGTIITTR